MGTGSMQASNESIQCRRWLLFLEHSKHHDLFDMKVINALLHIPTGQQETHQLTTTNRV